MNERTFLDEFLGELDFFANPNDEARQLRHRMMDAVMARLTKAFDMGVSLSMGARFAPDGGSLAISCTREPTITALMAAEIETRD